MVEEWGVVQKKAATPTSQFEIETTYDYRKADGALLFQVVRLKTPPGAKKEMLLRRPDPDKDRHWIWNVKGVRTTLYRLPELIAGAKLAAAEANKRTIATLPMITRSSGPTSGRRESRTRPRRTAPPVPTKSPSSASCSP